MAARADNDIKSDVISELEDLEYLDTGVSLLDAFVVEKVIVSSGRVDLELVFDDETPEATRQEVVAEAREQLEDIEGLILLVVDTLDRSSLVAQEPNLLHPRPGSARDEADLMAVMPPGAIPTEPFSANPEPTRAPEPAPAPASPVGGELTLGSLISTAAAGVPEDEVETPGYEIPVAQEAASSGGMSVYSGGGCGVGTSFEAFSAANDAQDPVEPASTQVEPASAQAEPAPVEGSGKVVNLNGGARREASGSSEGLEDVIAASRAGGDVTLSLARYTELIRAEQILDLLPTVEEVLDLERENAALRERLGMLESLLG